jgi:hypothetical protein
MINIVFVHLGDRTPRILIANLNRCKELFPQKQICVIGDNPKFLAAISRYCDSTYLFKAEDNVNAILKKNSHDQNFRDGFWLKTTLRLFAVTKYVQEQNIEKCLHIESDVLLGSDFPFHKFENLPKFSWSRFNGDHDVAAIFYVPDSSSAELFDEKFIEILVENPNLSDMTGLSRIGHGYPDMVEYLPSAESDESDLFNDRNVSKIDRELMSRNFDYFGGIFDSAPIGMWTLGQDPRNHRGLLKRNISLPESFINPSAVTCNVTPDSKFNVRSKGNYVQELSLFNLHVHSKNYKVFKTGSTGTLMKFFKTSAVNKQLTTFHPVIFLQCIHKGAKRRLLGLLRESNI